MLAPGRAKSVKIVVDRQVVDHAVGLFPYEMEEIWRRGDPAKCGMKALDVRNAGR